MNIKYFENYFWLTCWKYNKIFTTIKAHNNWQIYTLSECVIENFRYLKYALKAEKEFEKEKNSFFLSKTVSLNIARSSYKP